MRDGADVDLPGDVLRRPVARPRGLPAPRDTTPGERALGPWPYEVADTKLARHVKASAVLQICSYVEQLTAGPGPQPGAPARRARRGAPDATSAPRRGLHGLLPAGQGRVRGRGRLRARRGRSLPAGRARTRSRSSTATSAAGSCDCKAQRRADDDLSLVAGHHRQPAARRSRRAASATRRGLAGLARCRWRRALEGVSDDALERVREQARIQVEGEDAATIAVGAARARVATSDGRASSRTAGFLVLPAARPGRPVLRHRGRPVRARRRRRVPLRRPRARAWGRRGGPPPARPVRCSTRSGAATRDGRRHAGPPRRRRSSSSSTC